MEEDRKKQDIFMTYDFPSYLSSDCLTFGLKSLNSFYFCHKLFYFRKNKHHTTYTRQDNLSYTSICTAV